MKWSVSFKFISDFINSSGNNDEDDFDDNNYNDNDDDIMKMVMTTTMKMALLMITMIMMTTTATVTMTMMMIITHCLMSNIRNVQWGQHVDYSPLSTTMPFLPFWLFNIYIKECNYHYRALPWWDYCP